MSFERDDEPVLEWTPARRPERCVLAGDFARLEPLDADRHAAGLFAALHADGEFGLWDHLPYGPFADSAAYRAWVEEVTHETDPLFMAIVDREVERPEGVASYLRIEPLHGTIEIGHIALGPVLQRTRQATEAVFLLARHAFDDLGHRRLEWKCNARNGRSRRAAERFGFTFEGIFRQHMVVKGRNRDTAWFSMVDHEWPATRAGFERWLAPENFDAAGRQRQPLAALREGGERGP